MDEQKVEEIVNETIQIKEINIENKGLKNNQTPIVAAIILAGVLIAGAILLRGGSPQNVKTPVAGTGTPVTTTTIAPITTADRTLGNSNAKVTLVMYEDFQCPWCGKFVSESEQVIRSKYVANGSVQLVYRDFAFLGSFAQPYVAANDESINAAEAARCAEDQGQFWQYHDYLFSHQNPNGEDKGTFSVTNLESFAKTLGLNTTTFNQCLTSNKYAQAVADSKTEGEAAGVTGTPKGFILVNGKIVDTIDGYLPLASVTAKLDAALKD
jgi:protein-disulfide isomerase